MSSGFKFMSKSNLNFESLSKPQCETTFNLNALTRAATDNDDVIGGQIRLDVASTVPIMSLIVLLVLTLILVIVPRPLAVFLYSAKRESILFYLIG